MDIPTLLGGYVGGSTGTVRGLYCPELGHFSAVYFNEANPRDLHGGVEDGRIAGTDSLVVTGLINLEGYQEAVEEK